MSQNPIESLNEIKSMMQRSSKFTSISGWSGVWVGTIGLISALIAHFIVLKQQAYHSITQETIDIQLIGLGLLTLFFACLGGFYFMVKKSNQDQIKFINPTTKRILSRFMFLLCLGGIVCVLLYWNLSFVYIAPTTLLFYGLALYHVERDTIIEIKYLSFVEIFLGLLAYYFIYKGLLFWTIGFGVVHLIFGIWMVNKYDYKS